MKKIVLLIMVLLVPIVYAAVTPQQSFNFRNFYSIDSARNLTAGNVTSTWLTLGGDTIKAWSEVNGSGSADGIGNSNDTLVLMFANSSEIMNNDTVLTVIPNATLWSMFANVSQIAANFPNSNATLVLMFANSSEIMNNDTIIGMFANSSEIMNNATIVSYVNSSGYIKDWNSSGYIIDWGSSTVQANETIGHYINGTRYNQTMLYEYFANVTNLMNNVTILNVANASGNIIDWNESGLIINQTQFFTDTIGNSNDTLVLMFANSSEIMNNDTIIGMFANSSEIMNNVTIINYVNSSGNIVNWNESGYIIDQSSAGDGIGNSNDTLVLMFANSSEIMNNDTLIGMFANSSEIMNNDTILTVIPNATLWSMFANVSQIPASFPNSNDTLVGMFANSSEIMNNATIVSYVNSSGYIMDWNSSGYIIDWSGSTVQSNETIGHYINGTRYNQTMLYEYFANVTNLMNNDTILNVANASGYIFDWNESGLIINQTQFFSGGGNSNDTLILMFANLSDIMNNDTIIGMFANSSEIMNNDTILTVLPNATYWSMFVNLTNLNNNDTIFNLANASGFIYDWNESGFIFDFNETGNILDWNGSLTPQFMNLTGGGFTDDVNMTFNNVTTVDCITFASGGKICSG